MDYLKLPDSYDNWRTGNGGQDQFTRKCNCEACDTTKEIDDLIETTSDRLICDNCVEDYELCAKCDKAIDDDQSYDNEYCDCCNESRADDYYESSKGEGY